jgi:hypothetical protein
MGSGAFLVAVCRYLAGWLVKAWDNGDDHKAPTDSTLDKDLYARRLIAQSCLYGVDKNPFAVNLAKLSLWLFSLAFVGSCELPNWSGSCGELCVSVWMPAASAWLNCAFNWTRSTSPVRQRCSAPQNGRQPWSSWSHCSHRSMR